MVLRGCAAQIFALYERRKPLFAQLGSLAARLQRKTVVLRRKRAFHFIVRNPY